VQLAHPPAYLCRHESIDEWRMSWPLPSAVDDRAANEELTTLSHRSPAEHRRGRDAPQRRNGRSRRIDPEHTVVLRQRPRDMPITERDGSGERMRSQHNDVASSSSHD
jgi:hypothetical protein